MVTVLRVRVFPGKPGNQRTFEHFSFTFPVLLRRTCSHSTLGMVSQLVLERDEFTAGVQYGLRRIMERRDPQLKPEQLDVVSGLYKGKDPFL